MAEEYLIFSSDTRVIRLAVRAGQSLERVADYRCSGDSSADQRVVTVAEADAPEIACTTQTTFTIIPALIFIAISGTPFSGEINRMVDEWRTGPATPATG